MTLNTLPIIPQGCLIVGSFKVIVIGMFTKVISVLLLFFSPLRIATIEVQIAKLDSEAWPGLLDPERDRLILINEKEELLKELQYISPRQRLEPNDAEKLESEKKRLERDLQAARDNQSKALTERWECKFTRFISTSEQSA